MFGWSLAPWWDHCFTSIIHTGAAIMSSHHRSAFRNVHMWSELEGDQHTCFSGCLSSENKQVTWQLYSGTPANFYLLSNFVAKLMCNFVSVFSLCSNPELITSVLGQSSFISEAQSFYKVAKQNFNKVFLKKKKMRLCYTKQGHEFNTAISFSHLS